VPSSGRKVECQQAQQRGACQLPLAPMMATFWPASIMAEIGLDDKGDRSAWNIFETVDSPAMLVLSLVSKRM